MIAEVVKVGVKYAGPCIVCERPTLDTPSGRDSTLLIKRPDGRFAVCHPLCSGGEIRHSDRGWQFHGTRSFETELPF